ncbi:MAG: diphosphomevalonate decarboxylase [Kiritimatiellae bacterium]|nr:diphosphomevalonate decarboxylase [Kiritimatiellia bacterium]
MKLDPSSIVQRLIPRRTPVHEQASAYAPSNIALCKYWGKRNEALKLPLTGSLSVSLGDLGTHMRMQVADEDHFSLYGKTQSPDSKAYKRLFGFIDLFREPGTFLSIESHNTIPMGAGLASSASAFAAAVLALNDLYGWELDLKDLSILARLGSGSACRSVAHGFMEWLPGEREDGLDSFAVPLTLDWPEFRIGILTLSETEKAIGSGEGMLRTVRTSSLYKSWPDQVSRDLPRIREAVQKRDLVQLGEAAEQNALSMHATMISAWPPLLYWRPETVQVLHQVHALRAQGLLVYATMDAGPNVKLLFNREQQQKVTEHFPQLTVVDPFGPVERMGI